MSPAGRPTQTTASAWVQAALDTIEQDGVRALAVESVARRLQVSKGGFYHHFADRRALLQAALTEWEVRHVDGLATRLDQIADPRARLRSLLHYAAVEIEPSVITKLMAADDHPDVAAALARAAAARLALLEQLLGELGLAPAAARNRALLAYSAYLGLAHLRSQAPERLSTPRRMNAYLRDLEAALLYDTR